MREFIDTKMYQSELTPAKGIRFYSRMPLFQPHNLLDQEFLGYFVSNDCDFIGVEVQSTDKAGKLDIEFLADEYNFTDLGEGVFQLFLPGKGFQKELPKHYPWQKERKEIERWLISNPNL